MSSQAIALCEEEAAGNHGIASREFALDAGMSPSAISRLLCTGRWKRLQPRAYLVGGAPDTWFARLAAVSVSVREDFAFSHRTAGRLLELDGVEGDAIEIVTSSSPRLERVTIHRLRGQMPRTVRIHGFPVTSAQRTALDLFSVLNANAAGRALDDALRKRLTSIDRLWREYVETCDRGRNGCRAFRSAVLRRDHRDGKLQSRMESKLRRILDGLGGPTAVPQFPVTTPHGRYKIDFAFPEVKLGIEAQSIRWHMGEAKFYYDLRRDRHLKRSGWTLLYYTWDDLLVASSVRDEIADMRRTMERVLF